MVCYAQQKRLRWDRRHRLRSWPRARSHGDIFIVVILRRRSMCASVIPTKKASFLPPPSIAEQRQDRLMAARLRLYEKKLIWRNLCRQTQTRSAKLVQI